MSQYTRVSNTRRYVKKPNIFKPHNILYNIVRHYYYEIFYYGVQMYIWYQREIYIQWTIYFSSLYNRVSIIVSRRKRCDRLVVKKLTKQRKQQQSDTSREDSSRLLNSIPLATFILTLFLWSIYNNYKAPTRRSAHIPRRSHKYIHNTHTRKIFCYVCCEIMFPLHFFIFFIFLDLRLPYK